MNLTIDVFSEERSGWSILDLIRESELDSTNLAERPIAAKIAGNIVSLNYIPNPGTYRNADECTYGNREQYCGEEIHLLRYADSVGKDIYTRTLNYVVFMAVKELWPNSTAVIRCSIGNSVYITMEKCEGFDLSQLKERVSDIIRNNVPFVCRRTDRKTAIDHFQLIGQFDTADLLKWQNKDFVDTYVCDRYFDFSLGTMLPSSGYLTVWDIHSARNGIILLYPDDAVPDRVSEFTESPHYLFYYSEGEYWAKKMNCETVSDLNRLSAFGGIRELVRVNEALHENQFSHAAEEVCNRDVRIVMLAGPSSSGKTTSAFRLATRLRLHGKDPVLISLDNYYFDRDSIALGSDGKPDFEHINAIDTNLFRKNISELLEGREIKLPEFDFRLGNRVWNGKRLFLQPNSVIIVEGIHGLNPLLLPDSIERNSVYRIFVSPLLALKLDHHNRIPTTYLRLLRRIVRDCESRGNTVQDTISMWNSVRKGETKWIYPYQECADTILNTSTLYELAVLKRHVVPLLASVNPEDDCYNAAQSIFKIMDYIYPAEVDDEIPPTSIVREFIGGNLFYK